MDGLIIATRPPPRTTTNGTAAAAPAQEEFLTIATTTTTATTTAGPTRSDNPSAAPPVTQQSSLSEILDQLRSPSPTYDTVVRCFRCLDLSLDHDILRPSPHSSQITKVLLERTLPDFWAVLKRERGALARCLGSPTGLGGITARLKALIPPARNEEAAGASGARQNLGDLLDLLQVVLGRADFVHSVWELSIVKETEMKRDILWKEFATLVGGGRLLSVAAEAETTLGRLTPQERWVGTGKLYALWLGRGIAEACLGFDPDEADDAAAWKAMSVLLTASFRLGYSDSVVDGLVHKLITPQDDSAVRLRKLVVLLPVHDKRTFILSLLRVISTRHLQSDAFEDGDETWWKHDEAKVAGAAALLEKIVLHDDDYRSLVLEWLTSSSGGGIGEPIALRRAIMAVLAHEGLAFRGLFEKLLQQFADKLWIKHTPIMRQEVSVQILLLCAGIARQNSPSLLARLARSLNYLSGVSNHIASSSHRSRFLGMIVGEAFSALVDKDAKMKMSFETEDMLGSDAKWWKSIPYIEDKIGDIKDLISAPKSVVKKRKPVVAATSTTVSSSGIQVVDEQEDEEEEEEEDDEFTPYALPDSDTEDAPDEDATTIDRNKPSPPVYIRQLLSYLLSPDNYDKQLLALQHASALIRRKSGPGNTSKEVISHLSQLAAAFAGLDDRYDIPTFDELRRDALVALILAAPEKMGPWTARSFYTGDYGLAQRAMLLSTLGLAARELAGFTSAPPPTTPHLPAHISSVWGSTSDPITSLSSTLANTYLTPLAARAADSLSGPRILKVRTFSSRLAVQSRTPVPTTRPILQAFPYLLLPLTGGWSIAARDYAGAQPHADPALLVHLLNTLSVLVHAAGPAAPALADMCREVLQLLAGIRGSAAAAAAAAGEGRVREAVLLGVLTVLEVNLAGGRGARGVAEEFGGVLGEWRGFAERWVDGDGDAEERTRALAAGVLVRIGEVEEGWRRVLFAGSGVDEGF